MKILYIAHFREGSGWSRAALEYVKALITAGADVVCRTVKLGNPSPEMPEWFTECENKNAKGCDYIIQHVLPHYLVYSGKFKKNACIYATETSNFIRSGWVNYINLMDLALVICNQQCTASVTSGVNIPIQVVPHATDIEKYFKTRNKVDMGVGGDFVFYTISEWNTRKNIPALIRAFHSEFEPNEPVSLMIKTNLPGVPSDELAKEVIKTINKVKTDLRLYPDIQYYKSDLIQTTYLTEEELLELHYSCDCFVSPSYGEAWNYPAFDAMAMGKYPLVTNNTGMCDFIDNHKTGLAITSSKTLCGNIDSLPGLFTGSEEMESISIPHLKTAMRKVYENKNSKRVTPKMLNPWSYKTIGTKIMRLLDE